MKTTKCLLISNTGSTCSLDRDRSLRAILQLRNTLPPVQIIYGRSLRDMLTLVNRLEKFTNPHVWPLWRQAWAAKEEALNTCISWTTESLKSHTHPLQPLSVRDSYPPEIISGSLTPPSGTDWEW